MGNEKKQIGIQKLEKKDTILFYKEKKFYLFLNSFSLLQATAIYFSSLILSRTNDTKSSKQYLWYLSMPYLYLYLSMHYL